MEVMRKGIITGNADCFQLQGYIMELHIENGTLLSTERSEDTVVIVPDHVRVIGIRAFENQDKLTNIILPDKLEKIEWLAFLHCTSLKEIRIPAGVHTIEMGAFSTCTQLSSFIVPDTIQTCQSDVLYQCRSLHEITICRQDGSVFHFPVHSQYASGKLQILLNQVCTDEIPSEVLCRLYDRMIESGYDTSTRLIEYLFLSSVFLCMKHENYEALKEILSDEQRMQHVSAAAFDIVLNQANAEEKFEIQLMLMEAMRKYRITGQPDRFHL